MSISYCTLMTFHRLNHRPTNEKLDMIDHTQDRNGIIVHHGRQLQLVPLVADLVDRTFLESSARFDASLRGQLVPVPPLRS